MKMEPLLYYMYDIRKDYIPILLHVIAPGPFSADVCEFQTQLQLS